MLHRRAICAGLSALPFAAIGARAAANPAETFIADNITRGFAILNDPAVDAAQRRARFADFLLGLTDVRRVALFMLGRYAATMPAADQDAFVEAFRDFTLSVYQSYFMRYAGQTLRVLDSRERAPQDFVVRTTLVDPKSGPLEVDFRVRTDTGKPVLVDFGIGGIWLALAQRDQFTAVLGQSNGDVKPLIAHLREVEKSYR
jgi:phospholipid transport system substrate-binding protein